MRRLRHAVPRGRNPRLHLGDLRVLATARSMAALSRSRLRRHRRLRKRSLDSGGQQSRRDSQIEEHSQSPSSRAVFGPSVGRALRPPGSREALEPERGGTKQKRRRQVERGGRRRGGARCRKRDRFDGARRRRSDSNSYGGGRRERSPPAPAPRIGAHSSPQQLSGPRAGSRRSSSEGQQEEQAALAGPARRAAARTARAIPFRIRPFVTEARNATAPVPIPGEILLTPSV